MFHVHDSMIYEHISTQNASVLMRGCLMWHVCESSSSSLNDTWIHLCSESFCFDVMLSDVTRMWKFIIITQRYMNTSLLGMLLFWYDAVWYDTYVKVHHHHSTIHEYISARNASVLIWCCLIWHVCESSSSSLNDTWIHLWLECFCFDAKLSDVTSIWKFIIITQRYMNTSLIGILLFWCKAVWCEKDGAVHHHDSTIHEHISDWNTSVLMRSCLMWEGCDGSSSWLNDTWTHLWLEYFCFDAKLSDVRGMRWFISRCHQFMNLIIVETYLCCCHMVSCEKFVILHFHVWTIHEHMSDQHGSVLIW